MTMERFEDMLGKTIIKIDQVKDTEGDTIEVRFAFTDGSAAMLYHDQDCCENVTLSDIAGSLDSLIGMPLLMARETSDSDDPPGWTESHTWTFYLLATINGFVTLRWLGESNGYYSESVSFREIPATE